MLRETDLKIRNEQTRTSDDHDEHCGVHFAVDYKKMLSTDGGGQFIFAARLEK